MASATMLCRFLGTCCACECVCWFVSTVQVCVIPRGYGYTSNAARKHIHLPNTNSEKRKGLRCVRQEKTED